MQRPHIVEPHEILQIALGARHHPKRRELTCAARSEYLTQTTGLTVHVKTQFGAFEVIHPDEQAVVIIHEIVYEDVSIDPCPVHLPVQKVTVHQVTCHLVVFQTVYAFNGQSLTDDLGGVYGTVVHPHLDFLT